MEQYNAENLSLEKLVETKDLGAFISNKNLEKIIIKIYSKMQTEVEQVVSNDEEQEMVKL